MPNHIQLKNKTADDSNIEAIVKEKLKGLAHYCRMLIHFQ